MQRRVFTTVQAMVMNCAVGLPTVGGFGDVHTLVDLAVAAEQHGWDGVHLWDHVLYHESGWSVASPVVAAAAIAASTSRVRIILTVALPRRQVQDIAQDAAGIDALSRRRLTVLATIGSIDREYTDFGLDPDLRTRGSALDERLHRLVELWSQWTVPPIPIWCGGRWPHKPGLRRAARFDGAMPTFADQGSDGATIEQFAAAASFLRRLAPGAFDIALEGATDPAKPNVSLATPMPARPGGSKRSVGGVATRMPRCRASSPEHQPNPRSTATGAPLAPGTRGAVRQAGPELPRTLRASPSIGSTRRGQVWCALREQMSRSSAVVAEVGRSFEWWGWPHVSGGFNPRPGS
jgi:Luciferase-like monooxygenase